MKKPRRNRGGAELHGVSGSFWLPLRRRVRRLFQRGVDAVEGGAEFATDAVDCSDDHKRDAGRDQAVFDSGGAGLVGENFFRMLFNSASHWGLRGEGQQL
jgi:hypothetical protein